MAAPKVPQSRQRSKTGPWTEGLKPGEARCFTNRTLCDAERNIRMVRDGVESHWPLDSPCAHTLGPYGWVTDILLSGFSAHRQNGDIYIYKAAAEYGETEWKWS